MADINLGDYVQLLPRESPHTDDKRWWWRVVRVHDYGFDAAHERTSEDGRMTRVHATRLGVAYAAVQAHRLPS